MWGVFTVACAACAVMLFAPGFILLRAFGFQRVPAMAVSPCFSIATFAIEAIIFGFCEISCTWVNMLLPPFAFALCIYAIRLIVVRGRPCKEIPKRRYSRKDLGVFLLYLLLGVCATVYVYLSVLEDPTSFSQEYDNLFHLSLVERFTQTGQWSSLASSIYEDPLNPASNPAPNIAMYPSAWHAVCAIVAEMFSQSAPFAANVVNTIFMALVFPAGMHCLMQTLFPSNRRIVVAGAFAAVSFSSFPARLLWWGPIYPNLAANCLIPAVLALFIVMTQRGECRAARVCCAFAVLFGCCSLTLLQPNAVFASVVFLAPYCTWRVFSESKKRWPHADGATRLQRLFSLPVLLGALFACFVVAVWLGIYAALSGSPVLSFTWSSLMPLHEGVLNVLFLNYCYCPWAPALAFLIVLGIAYLLWKGNSRWLVASYAIMCCMLIITLSVDGELKHIVAGFWYTDQMRLAALAAIFGMPLAAAGCHAFFRFISFAVHRIPLPLDRRMLIEMVACAVTAVILLLSVFLPVDFGKTEAGAAHETAIGCIRNTLKWTYGKHPLWYYTNEEEQFIEAVLEQYPDEQFINNPFDGSCWAYGAEGMNVFYRAFDICVYDLESTQSKIIRLRLSDVASDSDVQEALEPMKARYVIMLDAYGMAYDAMYQWLYRVDRWAGLNGIDENTPGFELVMSKGDMRLYRITCLDDGAENGNES